MRCLMIPQIAGSEVAAESDYFSHQCVMRAVSEIEKSHYYVWLDSNQEGKMKPVPDRTIFYGDSLSGFNPQMATATGRLVELFNRQQGAYPVDVVFSSRAGLAPVLAVGLANINGPAVPVVITEPRIYWVGSEAHHNSVTYPDTVLRAAGYASCMAIYWSDWEKKEALDACSMWLAPAAVKHADEHGYVVHALAEEPKGVRKPNNQKRLLFAGRLNENKRYKDILSNYAKVVMARNDVEVWIHSGTGAFAKLEANDSRWHRTSERLTRQEYQDLLVNSDAGAYMSRDEGANITVMELVLANVVMVLPKRPWVEKLFWPLEYPFRASDSEYPAMLDWVLDHLEECRSQMAPVQALLRERNSWPSFKTKFSRVLEDARQGMNVEPFRKFRNVTLEMMEAQHRRELHFSMLMEATKSWREWPSVLVTRSAYASYNSIRDLDDMTSAAPVFVAGDKDFEWLKIQREAADK